MAEPSVLISGLLSFVQGRVKLIFHFWNCWPGRKQIFFKNLFLNLTNLFVVSFCVYERERQRGRGRDTGRRKALVWWCACVEVRERLVEPVLSSLLCVSRGGLELSLFGLAPSALIC